MIIGGALVWGFAEWETRRSKPRVLVDKETGQEVTQTNRSDLFFIPIRNWGWLSIGVVTSHTVVTVLEVESTRVRVASAAGEHDFANALSSTLERYAEKVGGDVVTEFREGVLFMGSCLTSRIEVELGSPSQPTVPVSDAGPCAGGDHPFLDVLIDLTP